jgi:hypothetical protein
MLISLTRKPARSARKTARNVAALVTAASLLSITCAFAQSDDEPVKDDGLMGSLMRGLGATDGSNNIQYRERSPLVVPRQLTLPPPAERLPETANWPKDPDVLERRAAREALAKRDRLKENSQYPLLPNELGPIGQARARTATVAPQPGRDEERRIINEGSGILNPSQLGFTSSFFGMFSSKKDTEVPFTSEPSRESLTQPPPGYQTPSSAQAYSGGKQEPAYVGNPDQQPQILPPGRF